MARTNHAVATTVGTLFALAFCSCTVFSLGAGTCTQGDNDHYLVGLMLCTPLALAAAGGFWASRSDTGFAAYVRVGVAGLLAVVFGLLLLPWVSSTTIAGHHSCGAEYDDFIPYDRAIDRFVPLGYLLLLVIVLVFALLPVFSRPTKQARDS